MNRPPRWTADGDGIAHAHRPGAIPAHSRCQACLDVLEPPATVACRAYMSHQSNHYQSGGVWSCRQCHPVGGTR